MTSPSWSGTLSPATRLESAQFLPGRRPVDVFPFFADALNLARITPREMGFEVVTPAPIRMGEGTLIDYRLRVRGVPLRWRSRITRWDPPFAFADTQVKGPYLHWHHLHTFEEVDGGTLARDVVDYRVFAGVLIGPLIRSDLRRIFTYRAQVLGETFGVPGTADLRFSAGA